MFDDTSVELIPKSAKAVAGYVNGAYATYSRVLYDFPKARHIGITVNSGGMSDCLDIEPGDATNADAAAWFHRFKGAAQANRKPSRKPIFYTSVSNLDALVADLNAAGIKRAAYKLWSAHYGEGKHVCSPEACGATHQHADATQWTSSSHSRSLDESRVKPSFWERG